MKEEIINTASLSFKEHWRLLGKRCIALPSKLIGFKPLCFIVATWLLYEGLISEWIWLCVLTMVLFGIVGLKVLTKYKSHESGEHIGTPLHGQPRRDAPTVGG